MTDSIGAVGIVVASRSSRFIAQNKNDCRGPRQLIVRGHRPSRSEVHWRNVARHIHGRIGTLGGCTHSI